MMRPPFLIVVLGAGTSRHIVSWASKLPCTGRISSRITWYEGVSKSYRTEPITK
jgi:hypothetical protein